MGKKILGLFQPVNWPSWAVLLWRVIDSWGNIEFLRGKMNTVIGFINSPWAVVLAVSWLFVVTFGGHKRLWSLLNRHRITKLADREMQPQQATDLRLDAFNHLNIERNHSWGLQVSKGIKGWPAWYAVKIYNIRPVDLVLSSYSVTILFDDRIIQVVSWAQGDNQASNGVKVEPELRLNGDRSRFLQIPVNLALVPTLPIQSPRWGARGQLRVSEFTTPLNIDLSTDNYQLSEQEWTELRQRVEDVDNVILPAN